jgi:sortase (surface protein transpeptidase)
VPSIGVNTSVAPKPTEMAHDPFINKTVPSFGVPDDLYTTTWWSSGPKPGSLGMAVVLGHTQIGGYGVFNNLAKLKPSQVIGLTRGNTTLRFQVLAVHTGISKKDPTALQTTLAHHPAAARLALLTCSGNFNQGYRESAENTVVFAKLVSVGH